LLLVQPIINSFLTTAVIIAAISAPLLEITVFSIRCDGSGLGVLDLDDVGGGGTPHGWGFRSGGVARRGKGGEDGGKDGELHDFNVFSMRITFKL
jgi:hypothetical protein